jgi:hypothetical protein
MAKLLNLAGQRPTLFNQLADFVPRDIGAPGTKLFPDGIKVVAERAEIIHSRVRSESGWNLTSR